MKTLIKIKNDYFGDFAHATYIDEINYLVKGRMTIQNTELNEGDIFIFNPYEIADPIFLEDCTVVIIKTPSVPGDKYVI